MAVLALDFDLIVDVEARVSPGEEFFDSLRADPFLLEQKLQDLVAEQALQLLYVCLRKDVKPALATLPDGSSPQRKSPIPTDERIHLIENRVPILSPIYIRADPLLQSRSNLHVSFCPGYRHYRRPSLAEIQRGSCS